MYCNGNIRIYNLVAYSLLYYRLQNNVKPSVKMPIMQMARARDVLFIIPLTAIYNLVIGLCLPQSAGCGFYTACNQTGIAGGWGTAGQQGFGEEAGMKTQLLHLIRSIRTVMRSKSSAFQDTACLSND